MKSATHTQKFWGLGGKKMSTNYLPTERCT
ncbi:uncharacterized protein METZ01_LOCUS283204, partial [marine metagenome]